MPAGNDGEAALAEVADQFGEGGGVAHAEDLIAANRQTYDGHYGKAQLRAVNQEATEELLQDKSDLAKSLDVEEKRIVTCAVRGEYTTYVLADEKGRQVKGALPTEAVGKTPAQAEKVEVEDVEAAPAPEEEAEAETEAASKGRSGNKKK